MGGDALQRTGEAQPLLGGSLDADLPLVDPHGGGKILPHGINVGGKLGLLRQHGSVHIADLIALLADQRDDGSEQLEAVCSLIPGIVIGKMFTDIPQCQRTQQRV